MTNFLDISVILVMILVGVWGARRPASRLVVVSAGILIGLFAAAFIYGRLAFLAEHSNVRTIVLGALAIAAAFLSYDIVFHIGKRLQRGTVSGKYRPSSLQKCVGAAVASVTCLVIIWLVSTMFSTSRVTLVQQQIRTSSIINFLNERIHAPALFRRVAHLLEPFSAPQVFIGVDPLFTSTDMMLSQEFASLDSATAKAKASVVRVSSWGCGSTSVGSGFLLTKNLIATNAHVIAGANRISIQDQNGTFAAHAIWFDPQLDIAILETTNTFAADPLELRKDTLPSGSIGSMIGYPGGANIMSQDAIIIQSLSASGYDIYDQAKITRPIYAFRASVVPGNSGGPLIDASGKVAGLIFGNSTSQAQTGYAITSDRIAAALLTASKQQGAVSSGSCSSM